MDKLERVQQSEMVKGLKHLPDEESLKKLELISLEKRCHKEDFINVYKSPKGGCKEDGAKLFSVAPSHRIRGNGQVLKHRRVPVNISKHFLTDRVTKHQQMVVQRV